MNKKNITLRAWMLSMLCVLTMQAWSAGIVKIATLQHGTITSSVSGTTCTLTVTPDAGYYITRDDITVQKTIDPGKAVRMAPGISQPITLTGDDPQALGESRTYTFTMPAAEYDVLVKATFTQCVAITPQVTLASWTYNQAAATPQVTGNTGQGAETFDYKVKGADDSTYKPEVPTQAGDYTVRATIAANGQYAAGTATADFKINKAAATISFTQATVNKRYDDPEFTLQVTNSGDGTITGYTSTNTMVATVDNQGKVTIKGYGQTTIKATVTDGTNYTYAEKTASYLLVVSFSREITFDGTEQWRTYVATEDLAVPEGMKAYAITGYGANEAVAQELGYIPQGVPVLLWRESTDAASFTAQLGQGTAPTGNLLQVAQADKQVEAGECYVLYGDEFVLVSEGTLPAGAVYLPLADNGSNPARRSISTDGTVTGIDTLQNAGLRTQGTVYDLQGRQVRQPAKGIYVIGGRKTIVK